MSLSLPHLLLNGGVIVHETFHAQRGPSGSSLPLLHVLPPTQLLKVIVR